MALKLLETKFIKDAWFANFHYQTRLCLSYADLAFAVSSPGLGNTAILNHIY
jgi:hypothetical protein